MWVRFKALGFWYAVSTRQSPTPLMDILPLTPVIEILQLRMCRNSSFTCSSKGWVDVGEGQLKALECVLSGSCIDQSGPLRPPLSGEGQSQLFPTCDGWGPISKFDGEALLWHSGPSCCWWLCRVCGPGAAGVCIGVNFLCYLRGTYKPYVQPCVELQGPFWVGPTNRWRAKRELWPPRWRTNPSPGQPCDSQWPWHRRTAPIPHTSCFWQMCNFTWLPVIFATVVAILEFWIFS